MHEINRESDKDTNWTVTQFAFNPRLSHLNLKGQACTRLNWIPKTSFDVHETIAYKVFG